MKLAQILERERIQIEENVYNVTQYGFIDMRTIECSDQFDSLVYNAENLDNDYEKSKTSYDIYKNDNILHKNLSENDVRKFLKTLEDKHDSI